MNIKILMKCKEALSKEDPDLSYVRGMLETLIDIETPLDNETATVLKWPNPDTQAGQVHHQYPVGKLVSADDPESPAAAAANAALAGIGSGPQPKQGILEKNITLN